MLSTSELDPAIEELLSASPDSSVTDVPSSVKDVPSSVKDVPSSVKDVSSSVSALVVKQSWSATSLLSLSGSKSVMPSLRGMVFAVPRRERDPTLRRRLALP